jgi:hypothetical protein
MLYPITLFGYEIDIPTNINIHAFIELLNKLPIREPFEVHVIVPFFDTECGEDDVYETHQDVIMMVIGFQPDNNLETTQDYAAQLKSYVIDNVVLEGIDIIGSAQFFCGIEWSTLHLLSVSELYFYERDSNEEEEEEEEEEEDEEVGVEVEEEGEEEECLELKPILPK